MMISAFDVAAEVIEYSNKKGYEITPLRLNTLLYFIYGWYLMETGLENIPLFKEKFLAYLYGPQVSEINEAYRRIEVVNIEGSVCGNSSVLSENIKSIIHGICDEGKTYPTMNLVRAAKKHNAYKKTKLHEEMDPKDIYYSFVERYSEK